MLILIILTFYLNNFFLLIILLDYFNIWIPRFCYHKKLSSSGNCRICLVEVKGSLKPLIASSLYGINKKNTCVLKYHSNTFLFNTCFFRKKKHNYSKRFFHLSFFNKENQVNENTFLKNNTQEEKIVGVVHVDLTNHIINKPKIIYLQYPKKTFFEKLIFFWEVFIYKLKFFIHWLLKKTFF